MKTTNVSALTKMAALMAVLVLTTSLAFGQQNATTLAGYKTLDICTVNGSTWRYSGEISVWNEGVLDTLGLNITDFIEYKTGNKWVKAWDMPVTPYPFGEIPAGTVKEYATIFKYTYEGAPLPGDIRNSASVTILNHSGWLPGSKNCKGTTPCPFGPNPKATYRGSIPPPPCETKKDCTYTQGYWSSKPGVVWPPPYARGDTFGQSSKTWQGVLDTPVGGNAYYNLAHQYIAAVLNKANGASVPQGVQDTLDLAAAWFISNAPSACPTGASCGLQKTWAGVLDDYNNGVYPGGPGHCDDE